MPIEHFPLWPGRKPAQPASEQDRTLVIAAHGIDRLEDDPELTGIVRFAAQLCDAPTALVTIVERHRQWFMARHGMDRRETPRPTSFCAHAMLGEDIFEIRDATLDARFADNPLVTETGGLRFYAGSPLVSSEGVPLGALCIIDTKPRPDGLTSLQREGLTVLARAVMQRLTCQRENQLANETLDEADRRLLALAEHLPIYAWSSDQEGNVEYANSALYGYVGTNDPSRITLPNLVHPDDLEMVLAQREQALSAGRGWETRARILGSEGEYRMMIMRNWPMREGVEQPAGTWFGAAVDIDELHRLSESRELLAGELSHRIKNIFTVVSSLVVLRARGRDGVDEFAQELSETIRALGRAHDYVRPVEGLKGTSLRELLDGLLAPYRHEGGSIIEIAGTDAPIGSRSATPLALIFHELATNSAKYGALSVSDGHITITVGQDGETVTVDWRESGGAGRSDSSDGGEGFGTRLIASALERQLGGSINRRLVERGIEITLTIPIEAIA